MKKHILFIAIALYSCLNAFSQATSMTVDCQTPGWLSSMINYGDQQTLKNIKVTGYINEADLSFIGSLNSNQQLNGVIDLEDVQIVGATNDDNNKITQGYFGSHINRLILPISLVSINCCLHSSTTYTAVDTLVVGGEALPVITNGMFYPNIYSGGDGIRFNKNVKHLILREGVTSIEKRAFYNGDNAANSVFESIVFPKTLKTIGEYSFYGCYHLIFDLSDVVEEIGDCAFQNTSYSPDTLKLPESLKVYYMSAFPLKENQVIIIPQYVEQVYNYKKSYNNTYNIYYYSAYLTSDNCSSIYIYATNPPTVIDYTGNTYDGVDSGQSFKGLTIYVPQGTSSSYKSANSWKKATIIENIRVNNIFFTQNDCLMYVADTKRLNVIIEPNNAINQKVTWESSNTDVVTVSEGGLITAMSPGKVNITATTVDGGFKATCEINVYEHTTGVQMVDNVSIPINGQYELNAQTLPLSISDGRIEYGCSNNSIATINNAGTITGIAKGSCTITATTVDGGYTAECLVTVMQPVEALTLEKHSLSLKVGETETMYAQIAPATADDKALTWYSRNEEVATVDENGKVNALKSGEAWIVAVSKDNAEAKDSCKVSVLQPVKGITLNQNTCQLNGIGESFSLEAMVSPDDASNKNIKWMSSDESVCVVSNGTVVAVGEGTCVIIATTEDGGFMATCTVTVVSPSGISQAEIGDDKSFQVYDASGTRLTHFQKGLNIIRFADGTRKKVLVR